MASRRLLLRAAKLLKEQAFRLRESCEGNDRFWGCTSCRAQAEGKCRAQLSYDELMRTVKDLREAA